jgi:hypothetical protein
LLWEAVEINLRPKPLFPRVKFMRFLFSFGAHLFADADASISSAFKLCGRPSPFMRFIERLLLKCENEKNVSLWQRKLKMIHAMKNKIPLKFIWKKNSGKAISFFPF